MIISARTRRTLISTIAAAVIAGGMLIATPSAYAAESVVAHSVTAPKAAVLKTTPTPTISGTVAVGSALTGKPGTWGNGVKLKYQWFAGGVAIKGATLTKFTLTKAQVGKKITVRVTGSKTGYTSVSKTSAATKAVPAVASKPAPLRTLKTGAVTISGTSAAGQKLTAKPGTWTSATTLKYQWFVAGKAVSKATAKTYVVRPTDVDRAITVKVTGSKSGYATKTIASPATKKVTGKVYANCAAMNKDYPSGIRKSSAKGDVKSGVLKPFVGKPFVSNALYAKQSIARDRDRDGIMCER